MGLSASMTWHACVSINDTHTFYFGEPMTALFISKIARRRRENAPLKGPTPKSGREVA
jgi:hypothetical protein